MRAGRHGTTLIAGLILTGCVTVPGQMARPGFVPRIVDREYGVVWKTLVAALRNEGALLQVVDQRGGAIETAYRLRPGTKIRARGLLGEEETQNLQVQVRYSVRASPLGPEKTEVRLRTEMQYLNQVSTWVSATDDGGLAESFWRRFEQDLAYYGLQPEKWRPDEPRRDPSRPEPGPEGVLPGRESAGPQAP